MGMKGWSHAAGTGFAGEATHQLCVALSPSSSVLPPLCLVGPDAAAVLYARKFGRLRAMGE